MQDEKTTHKTKGKFRRKGVIALSVFLCLLVGAVIMIKGLIVDRMPESMMAQNTIGETVETGNEGEGDADAADGASGVRYTEETIIYGEAQEWERWTDYLISISGKEDYAVAFVQAGEASADFTWRFYDNREIFMTEVSDETDRANAAQAPDSAMGKEEYLPWYFEKMRLDEDTYGTDILEYYNKNYVVLVKKDAVTQDGYMYVLSCENGYEDNSEEVNEVLIGFADSLNDGMNQTDTVMDGEELYWIDHEQRITQLEEPVRSFIQVRARGLEFDSYEHIEYFPLMTEAAYRIMLSPELPEMEVCFHYLKEIPENPYEIRLLYASAVMGPYQMEIRNAQDDSLIQRTDLELCIEEIDTITFEDIDGDGYLDMKIIFPLHGSDELYSYQDYWTWDKDLEKMIRIEEEELLARREKNQQENLQEYPQTTNLSVIPVTVEKGDSLWKIAVEYYGDGEKWIKIYEYNYPAIGDNPSLIYEGTELRLPWGRDWN